MMTKISYRRYCMKKVVIVVLVAVCMFQAASAFAGGCYRGGYWRGGWGYGYGCRGYYGGWYPGYGYGYSYGYYNAYPCYPAVVAAPPVVVAPTVVAGPQVVVSPGNLLDFVYNTAALAVGTVVGVLPWGATTVVVDGNTYYTSGNTYYKAVPGGYSVVNPPTTQQVVEQPQQQQQIQPQQSVQQQPQMQQKTSININAQPKSSTMKGFEVKLPNGNGSFTSLTLMKTDKGFIGPQGEFYQDHPTEEQLRARYLSK
jgi:hypothetical protein